MRGIAKFVSLFAAVACAPSLPPSVPGDPLAYSSHYVRGSKEAHADTVIVFVHGVFGSSVDTWTNPMTHAYWPDLLTNDPAFAGADVYVHAYPSPMRSRSYTIDELADELRLHLDDDNVFRNHKQVIFLCHSMGGLVVRAYLLKYQRLAGQVPMIDFFSTPTTGAHVANVGRLLSANPQLGGMRKMTTKDPHELGIWESQWAASGLGKKIQSYCAYETLATHGIQVVDRESATHLCTEHLDPMARDHLSIVKPADARDEPYIAFRQAYRTAIDSAQAPWIVQPINGGKETNTPTTYSASWYDVKFIGSEGWLAGAYEVQGGPNQFIGRGVLLHTVNGKDWEDITGRIERDSGSFGNWPQRWNGIGPISAIDVYPRRGDDGRAHNEGYLASYTGVYTTDDAAAGQWRRISPSPSRRDGYAHFVRMIDIEGFAEIYTVGWQGIAHRRRDGQWEVQLPTYLYLINGITVSGNSERELWAVGHKEKDDFDNRFSDTHGAIYHAPWPDGPWTEVRTGIAFAPRQSLYDVVQLDEGIVVAVGDGGLVIVGKRDGGEWRWEKGTSGTTERLNVVAGPASSADCRTDEDPLLRERRLDRRRPRRPAAAGGWRVTPRRYASDSAISSIVARRHVYIGVSRTVYFDDSVSRRSCTRSRNSAGASASKATTKS